jgi:hypothetical protein
MDRWSENGNEVPEAEETIQRGGAMAAEADEDDAKRKIADREQKKAEVRKRLEEASKKGKKKKGFLTPERKKKLRKLLMSKAAENLKNQQKQLDQERQNVLSKRVVPCPNIDTIEDKGQLEKIYNDLFTRMIALEEEKYDINFVVSQKDSEINELTIAVNDLRGKFVKPTLKKVSKYDNKFKKLAEASSGEGGAPVTKKADFRSQLKVVKKENAIEAIESKTKKVEKPEWTKKAGGAEEPPKAGSIRRSSQASSKAEEPKEEPVEQAEPEEEEQEEEEEEQEEEEE